VGLDGPIPAAGVRADARGALGNGALHADQEIIACSSHLHLARLIELYDRGEISLQSRQHAVSPVVPDE
jgi:hypothetical protein